MPWGDWQFWIVTIAAIVSVTLAARTLIPRKSRSQTKRTALTVSAERRTDRTA